MRTAARFMGRKTLGHNRTRTAVVSALTLALLTACGGDKPTEPDPVDPTDPTPPALASVEVSPSADTLTALEEEVELEAIVLDEEGGEVTGQNLVWSSSDEDVIEINEDGVATAIGNGTAEITASVAGEEGVSGSSTLVVEQSVATLEVEPDSVVLTGIGATQELTATAYDANDHEVEGVEVEWSSSDEDVIEVDEDGVATAIGNGTAEITASVAGEEGVSGSSTLLVEQSVATLEVEPDSVVLTGIGATQELTATAFDANDHEVEGVEVEWSSSDEDVIEVDEDGVATAKGLGTAMITATVGEIEADAELTVTQTAAELRFRTQPADGVAGVELDPVVEILDEDGEVVDGATDAITIELVGGPSDATLSGTATVSAVKGVATFSDLSVERAGKDYTLHASASGLGADTSTAFEIVPGPAAALALEGEMDDESAGGTLSPLEVRVEDAYGNLVEDAELDVEATIGSGPSGAVLGGTTMLQTAAGVAVFDDLDIERAAEGYTLRVSAVDLDDAESGSFDIVAGPATELRFVSLPNRIKASKRFRVGVAVEDAYGNLVEDDSVAFELGLSPRTDAALDVEANMTIKGEAIVYRASIDVPGTGFTLKASASGLNTVESDPFDVGLEIAQLATGNYFACALTTSKDAYCWGDPPIQRGQLGDGEEDGSLLPVLVSGGHAFKTIATGASHACGLTEDGKAYCWGYNGAGRLGDGTETGRAEPVEVAGGHRFHEVMAAQYHTCALADTHDVYCWGSNGNGYLGDGGRGTNQNEPVKVVGNHHFVALSEGGSLGDAAHTCAITNDGKTYCWGLGTDGQLGNGQFGIVRDEPVLVTGDHDFAAIATGGGHTCALTEAGEAYCWGKSDAGQRGDSTSTSQASPTAVKGNHTFAAISVDRSATCALTESGQAYCWGENGDGQLGDGTQNDRSGPVLVNTTQTFDSIAVGPRFACAITSDGEAYCWGSNDFGEFGDGTTDGSLTPVRVEY